MYGFSGGGLPAGIKTVAVLPFENLTSDPTLTAEINRAVREAVQDRLGLRQAGENQADALVRGTITRYEPDLPVSFTAAENNQVNVNKRLVQIVVSVEILNQREEKSSGSAKASWSKATTRPDRKPPAGNARSTS
jgi:hypothetical protein